MNNVIDNYLIIIEMKEILRVLREYIFYLGCMEMIFIMIFEMWEGFEWSRKFRYKFKGK